MRTLKIAICSIFVLFGGLLFSACGEKNNFETKNIVIDENIFTYDGETKIVDVSYKGVDANVTFALSTDKNNFKSASDLNLRNAGTYELYYRLSANGYNDFISTDTLELIIQPRTVNVTMLDKYVMKSAMTNSWSMQVYPNGFVGQDASQLRFNFVEDTEIADLVCGESYDVECSLDNPNYNLVVNTAKMHVLDYCHIEKGDNSKVYYSKLEDAVAAAENGETVVLNSNMTISKQISTTKDITIDGCGIYKITAGSTFETKMYANSKLKSMFNVFNNNAKITLKNITVDGNGLARCVSAFAGNITIDGATIQNGKKVDEWRSGGVYVTAKATFTMTSGQIKNNNANDEEYTKY